MDQSLSQVLSACNLARELHANLANIANQPESLISSCEQVVAAFNKAIIELRWQCRPSVDSHMFFGEASDRQPYSGFEERVQAIDLLGVGLRGPAENEMASPMTTLQAGATVFGAIDAPAMASPFVGGGESTSSGYGRRPAGSLGQRSSRKRKDSSGTSTIRVPAVRNGNMDIPPDDGFTWRKYGQKDILRSKFPRSYYRCTHKNFYGCEAKKQVQRLDEDPSTYEVTYCGEHTCQTSTTPLVLPPLAPNKTPQGENPFMLEYTKPPPSSLSMPIELGISWFPQEFDEGQRAFYSHGGESRVANVVTSDCPVTDLADAMFNSGSSGSSMDAIFALKQQNYKDKEE